MAKFILEEELEFDFKLMGISSHVQDYRLCWTVNRTLGLDLIKSDEEIIIRLNKVDEPLCFSNYYYQDLDSEVEFELICNRHEQGFLIPELKAADYFLKVSDFYSKSLDELIFALRKSSLINMAFEIDVNSLRSRQNLLYI
jgi:hypothetical protein